MFSGIVETTGRVTGRGAGGLVLAPKKPLAGLKVGESVAVDGVCLTLDSQKAGRLAFRLLPETCRVTTLGSLRAGALVNLERSLRLGARVSGHLMLGHVDAVGTLSGRRRRKGTLTLEIRIPRELSDCLVPKGPIGVDGVSLTLDAKIEAGRFRVHLIRHTLAVTTLSLKGLGSS
jgi:riboflavin synthase